MTKRAIKLLKDYEEEITRDDDISLGSKMEIWDKIYEIRRVIDRDKYVEKITGGGE